MVLKFPDIKQEYPARRPAEQRREDFDEIYAGFIDKAAETQASRCSQCGIPFCQVHCPLQNNIPDWLKLTSEGRVREAWEISAATNTFPEICGRICPQDRLCEGNCVINKGFKSVTIGAVEKFLTDAAWKENWITPFKPAEELPYSVGIIGSGPAGLAAAERLRRAGCSVHVYDRHDRVGGLLIYGIPGFKLEKDIVQRRHQWLADSGIQFHTGADIGGSIPLEELQDKHDALLIATGVYKARLLDIPGAQKDSITPALDYLIASNRKGLGDHVSAFDSGTLNAEGKRVVVIGGGDTAMDCVRTAIRQGAKEVTCLYRRDRANMPGSQQEVRNAEEEGVRFEWLSAPEAFDGGSKDGQRIIASRMRLGLPDSSGRRTPEPIPDSRFTLESDMTIQALGFDPEDLPALFNEPKLRVQKYGTLHVDNRMMTNLPGVFAAGDIVRGASLVVWAIRDGRDASAHILRYLHQQAQRKGRKKAA